MERILMSVDKQYLMAVMAEWLEGDYACDLYVHKGFSHLPRVIEVTNMNFALKVKEIAHCGIHVQKKNKNDK